MPKRDREIFTHFAFVFGSFHKLLEKLEDPLFSTQTIFPLKMKLHVENWAHQLKQRKHFT